MRRCSAPAYTRRDGWGIGLATRFPLDPREGAVKVSIVRSTLFTFAVVSCSDSGTEPPRLGRLEVHLDRPASSLLIHDTVRARLLGFDQSGHPYPAGPVTWRSSDPSVVQVDAEGLVEGVGPGSATIVARVGVLADSLRLPVAGTLHNTPITTSELWTLAGAPHVVRGTVSVGGAAGVVVTIEPGVAVLFADGAGLTFGLGATGSLVASGSPTAPIELRGAGTTSTPGSWIGLTLRGVNQSVLRNVTLSGCGGARSDEQPTACVVLGHRFLGSDPTVLVENVTVQDAAAAAIILQGESRFAAGSTSLSVHNVRGLVASLPAAAVADFPLGGSFAGNDLNEIRVLNDTIRTSATWGDPGVPWHVLEPVLIEGAQGPVLTIPAGLSMRFAFGGGFVVGRGAPGGVRIGSAGAAPVSLVSSDENGWAGVVFWPSALPSSISEATLDNCGSYQDSPDGHGCVVMAGNFFGTGPAPVLENVTIRRGIWAGVAMVGSGRFGEGSHNVVITKTSGSPGTPVYVRGSSPSSIPPGRYTGNALDAIWLSRAEVTTSEVWRNHGVPYRLSEGLLIGHVSAPVLTLEPGVVLQFAPGGLISVGGLAPGGLRAAGLDTAAVVLTGEWEFPGAWGGLEIGPQADPGTLLDRVIVDYAGAAGQPGAAGIRIARDFGEIVRNTLIRRSGGCGITRTSGVPWSTDFTAASLSNTFQDNVGPAQCGP